jgi:hypothetical protein
MTMRAALAALLLFSAIGCKPESARRSDIAAKQVVEKRRHIGKTIIEPEKFAEQAGELAAAEHAFLTRRKSRVTILRGQHSVVASQTTLISLLAQGFPISDASRADINAKLHAFQMQLDKTANDIEQLQRVSADAWEARDEAMIAQLDKLDELRRAAWHSLDEAPLVPSPGLSRVSVRADGQSTRVQRHARRAH